MEKGSGEGAVGWQAGSARAMMCAQWGSTTLAVGVGTLGKRKCGLKSKHGTCFSRAVGMQGRC